MFEQLFTTAPTIASHREAPYSLEREHYLKHYADQGYKVRYLRKLSGMLLRIVHALKDFPKSKISEEQIRTAAQRAAQRQCGFYKIRNNREFRKRFAREAKHWLRFLGRFHQESNIKPVSFSDKLDEFAVWMQQERGLSPLTVEKRCWYIATFLRWFGVLRGALKPGSGGNMLHGIC
jgi:integrase/recombinase XerD